MRRNLGTNALSNVLQGREEPSQLSRGFNSAKERRPTRPHQAHRASGQTPEPGQTHGATKQTPKHHSQLPAAASDPRPRGEIISQSPAPATLSKGRADSQRREEVEKMTQTHCDLQTTKTTKQPPPRHSPVSRCAAAGKRRMSWSSCSRRRRDTPAPGKRHHARRPHTEETKCPESSPQMSGGISRMAGSSYPKTASQ